MFRIKILIIPLIILTSCIDEPSPSEMETSTAEDSGLADRGARLPDMGEAPPVSCIEGETRSCLCPPQRDGVQLCLADGTYGTCDCGDEPPPPPPPPLDEGVADPCASARVEDCPCSPNLRCQSPFVCEGGVCVESTCPETDAPLNCDCDDDTDCADGLVCESGVCIEQSCVPGSEGCECDENSCDAGLTCNGICEPSPRCADNPDDPLCAGERLCVEGYAGVEGECVQCLAATCEGEGLTGRLSAITNRAGECLCETEVGYFIDISAQRGGRARACDTDNDGWVAISGLRAMLFTDSRHNQEARCSVRTIDRVELISEDGFTQRGLQLSEQLNTPELFVPLIEQDWADDLELLDNQGLPLLDGINRPPRSPNGALESGSIVTSKSESNVHLFPC